VGPRRPALVHLWRDRAGPLARLLRIDVQRGQVNEERSLGPGEPTGWLGTAQVVLSPDGQEAALMLGRALGHLDVLRDLPAAQR